MSKPFKAIAAMSLNRVIGAGNKIPWHLPEDFRWFKKMTTGQLIVMDKITLSQMFLEWLERKPRMVDLWGDFREVPTDRTPLTR